jgi:hypothetical protein
VSRTSASVGRPVPAEAAASAGGVHLASLERAFGRIFTVVTIGYVLDFWFSAGTLSGQRPGSVTASLLLSLLLIWRAIRTVRRPLSQQDLNWLAAATGALVLASRILAVPGSPFLLGRPICSLIRSSSPGQQCPAVSRRWSLSCWSSSARESGGSAEIIR